MNRKILIVTGATSNLKYQYEITNKNKQLYSSLYKYEYKFIDLKNIANAKKYKIPIILDNIKYADYIIWMDCDTWFNNFNINFDSIIDNYQNSALIVARDNGLGQYVDKFHMAYINSGVLIFKSNDISREIIRRWQNIPEPAKIWLSTKTTLVDQPPLSLRILFDDFVSKNTAVVESNILNRIVHYGYDENTFICHATYMQRYKDKMYEKFKSFNIKIQ